MLFYYYVFLWWQARRKFQYFAIQDSSIIMGLLEESLKAKGRAGSSNAIILVKWKTLGLRNIAKRENSLSAILSFCITNIMPCPNCHINSWIISIVIFIYDVCVFQTHYRPCHQLSVDRRVAMCGPCNSGSSQGRKMYSDIIIYLHFHTIHTQPVLFDRSA